MNKRGLAKTARVQGMLLDWHYDGRYKTTNKNADEKEGRCAQNVDNQTHK